MEVIHHMTLEQIDVLFRVFAKPVPHPDLGIDWVAPAWIYLLYATVRANG